MVQISLTIRTFANDNLRFGSRRDRLGSGEQEYSSTSKMKNSLWCSTTISLEIGTPSPTARVQLQVP